MACQHHAILDYININDLQRVEQGDDVAGYCLLLPLGGLNLVLVSDTPKQTLPNRGIGAGGMQIDLDVSTKNSQNLVLYSFNA